MKKGIKLSVLFRNLLIFSCLFVAYHLKAQNEYLLYPTTKNFIGAPQKCANDSIIGLLNGERTTLAKELKKISGKSQKPILFISNWSDDNYKCTLLLDSIHYLRLSKKYTVLVLFKDYNHLAEYTKSIQEHHDWRSFHLYVANVGKDNSGLRDDSETQFKLLKSNLDIIDTYTGNNIPFNELENALKYADNDDYQTSPLYINKMKCSKDEARYFYEKKIVPGGIELKLYHVNSKTSSNTFLMKCGYSLMDSTIRYMTGNWEYFYWGGAKKSTFQIRNNIPFKYVSWHEDGTLEKEISQLDDGMALLKEYNLDGHLFSVMEVVNNSPLRKTIYIQDIPYKEIQYNKDKTETVFLLRDGVTNVKKLLVKNFQVELERLNTYKEWKIEVSDFGLIIPYNLNNKKQKEPRQIVLVPWSDMLKVSIVDGKGISNFDPSDAGIDLRSYDNYLKYTTQDVTLLKERYFSKNLPKTLTYQNKVYNKDDPDFAWIYALIRLDKEEMKKSAYYLKMFNEAIDFFNDLKFIKQYK